MIGFPLGIISALNRGRWPDNTIRIITVLLNTVPEWWIGLLLLIILGGYLGLVPLGGMYDHRRRLAAGPAASPVAAGDGQFHRRLDRLFAHPAL